MDLGTAILLGAVGALALNRAILALPGWHRRRVLFWSIQLLNLAAACFMIVHGVPELQGLAFYANWVIAMLFMLHIVQNNSRYVAARKAELGGEDEATATRRQQISAALRRGSAADAEPASTEEPPGP